MSEAMIQADGLVKIYKTKQTEVLALQGLDLTVEAGELTALIGNSGSGKSTFLNMIGGLDRPSAGSLTVCGKNLFKMSEKELVEYKRDTVGSSGRIMDEIFYPTCRHWKMLCFRCICRIKERKKRRHWNCWNVLEWKQKKNSKMSTMSGGEQQRIAIAIAIGEFPRTFTGR